MKRYGKVLIFRSLKLLHYLIGVAIFVLFWHATAYGYVNTVGIVNNLVMPSVYAVVLLLLLRVYNAYDLTFSRPIENFISQSLSHTLAAGILYVLVSIAAQSLINPLPAIILLVVQAAFNCVWGVLANLAYRRLYPPLRTLVVFGKEAQPSRIQELQSHMQNFRIVNSISYHDADPQPLLSKLQGHDVIFVLGMGPAMRNSIAKYCLAHGMECFCTPCIGDILMAGARHMESFSIPVMRISRADSVPEYRIIKRVIDVLLSALGLLVTLPIMLVTALAIRLYDGGPVFYLQTRLTRNARPFRIVKFRSMRTDAESDGVARLSTQNDDRITPVGRIIRACRIDELPQLWNILKGDMSLVGPRPERPEIAREYEETIPDFGLRLQVKAGLTGYAQIYGRYNTAPYEKLQMDLLYIGKMSLTLDLKLILATIKILMQKESTAGVDEGSTTAIS